MIEFAGLRLIRSATTDLFMATRWEDTPLGALENWPPAYRIVVQTCLNSAFPVTLGLGDQLILVYNDGYIPIMGDKHPGGFGRTVHQTYPELAEFLGPRIEAAFGQAEVIWERDQLLPLVRTARAEEAYFTFCYSSINDERGLPIGVMSIANETTEEVLARRRNQTIVKLAETLVKFRVYERVIPAIVEVLRQNQADFARLAVFSFRADGECVTHLSHPPGYGSTMLGTDRLATVVARLLEATEPVADLLQVSERGYAITLAGTAQFPSAAYALVAEPDDLVDSGASYERFLEVVRDIITGASYRIVVEREALDDVRRKLDDRERMYRMLYEQSKDGIAISRPDGVILAVNPAGCQLVGRSEAEICGLGFAGTIDDSDGSLTRALEAQRQRGVYSGELRLITADGPRVVVDVSSVMFFDQQAGETRIFSILRDASDRLITQERLMTSARLEALGQLTAGISHDFNNLLNVILHGAEHVLERLPDEAAIRESTETVLMAAQRAAELIRQLLSFSRQKPMVEQAVMLADAMVELERFLARAIGPQCRLECVTLANPRVLLDPAQLQSAVLNLCINARDAMRDGGTLTLTVSTCRLDRGAADRLDLAEGDYARLSVNDTGTGIPAEYRDRVIEPFFTTKAAGEGTGLGLSMVYGFARQSRGALEIRSEPGQGTEVILYFPPYAGDQLQAPPADGESRVLAAGAGQHVLVVEDNAMLATMLERLLEGAGYRVTALADPSAAVDLLAGDMPVDLLLSDILLGAKIDGWQLIQEAMRLRPGLRAIAISGYNPAETAPAAALAEVETLAKPFRPKQLLAAVERQLLRPLSASDGRQDRQT